MNTDGFELDSSTMQNILGHSSRRSRRRNASLVSRGARDGSCISTATEFRKFVRSLTQSCGALLRRNANMCCVSNDIAFLGGVGRLVTHKHTSISPYMTPIIKTAHDIYMWLLSAAPHQVLDQHYRSIDIDLSLGGNDVALFSLGRKLRSEVDMTFRVARRADRLPVTDGLRGILRVQRKVGEAHASLNLHSLLPCIGCLDRLSVQVSVPTTGNDRVLANNTLSEDGSMLEAVCNLIHFYVGDTALYNFHIAFPLPLSPVPVTKRQVVDRLRTRYGWNHTSTHGFHFTNGSQSRQLTGMKLDGVKMLVVAPL